MLGKLGETVVMPPASYTCRRNLLASRSVEVERLSV